MATFLDITGLEYFSSLFVLLFTWAIVYAVFLISKIFGDNKVLPIFVGFILSLLAMFNPVIVSIIRDIAPWIGLIFVLIMLMLTATKILIPGQEAMTMGARGVVLILILFITVVAILAKIRGNIQAPGEGINEGKDYSKNVNVLLNPKILGMLLLLAVAIFTIALLTAVG